jgi:hypothetical protein
MKVKTTYLEMLAHQQRGVPPPRERLTMVQARKPSVAHYRFLYDAVGRDYDWTSRKKLPDGELAALLNDPGYVVRVLHTIRHLLAFPRRVRLVRQPVLHRRWSGHSIQRLHVARSNRHRGDRSDGEPLGAFGAGAPLGSAPRCQGVPRADCTLAWEVRTRVVGGLGHPRHPRQDELAAFIGSRPPLRS